MNDSKDALQVTWTEAEFASEVRLSAAVLERLRYLSVEGLKAIPRVGLGLGGLLLGKREETGLVVEDLVEIPCSHASGPSFSLTPEERQQALQLVREERPNSVVGWYLSKTRAPFEPSQSLYDELCPEPWQVTLLLVPAASQTARARLFFRGADGTVAGGEEHELVEPGDDGSVPVPGEVGFTSVRSFGLVAGQQKKRAVAAPSSPPPQEDGPSEGPWGFTPAPPIRLKGQAARSHPVSHDSDVNGEPGAVFEAIRTVRFVGKKPSIASPLHPELEEMAATSLPEPEPEPDPVLAPPPLPDGPVAFEPIRRIEFSSREKLPPPGAPPVADSLQPAEFQPARKSMFLEELQPASAAPVALTAETPPLPLTKSIQFAEAEPARDADPPPAVTPVATAPIRTVAFMSKEDKKSERQQMMDELQREDERRDEKPALSPEAIRRRKILMSGVGIAALAATVFLTRGLWMPTPLKLELTESSGHITALWNAETLPGGASGSLTVNDGGQTKTIQLNATKLAEGVTGFDHKADTVRATLNAGGKTVSSEWKR